MSEPMRDEVELPELETKHGGHCQCIVCDKEYWYQVAKEREAQLKAALAANREKDAEIERLKSYRSWDRIHELEAELSSLRASEYAACTEIVENFELASLRASGGEKWIDVEQELPPAYKPCLVYRRPGSFEEEGLYMQSAYRTDPPPLEISYWMNLNNHTPLTGEVTHWQPLPEPPTVIEVRENRSNRKEVVNSWNQRSETR